MDAVADIKARLRVEEVIAEYVELKPAGRNLKALSPFTQEKTPSFMISPEKQIWHDFSSGKGGDMFTFVMEAEGIDFKEALSMLARKAGLDLSQYQRHSQGRPAEQRAELENALKLASRFYQEQLVKQPKARDYVTKTRGFNRQVIKDFLIGYAPAGPQALYAHLKDKGIKDKAIMASGLAVRRGSRMVDMFRNRIVVALADRSGRPIGFTGRLLGDNISGPKYINTAQTPLYDKSRHVFGLHLAKQAIREADLAVIAEGNLDVVSAHQAGYANVVATAGTALTVPQLQQLKYLSSNVALAFDGDAAGLRATLRSIPLAQAQGINLYVMPLEPGQDPDDIIRHSPARWQQLVEQKQYALDWVRSYYLTEFDTSSAPGKKRYVAHMLEALRGVSDAVEQEHYMTLVAHDVGSSVTAIKERYSELTSQRSSNRPSRRKVRTVLSAPPPRHRIILNHLLAICLTYPKTRLALNALPAEIEGLDENQAAALQVLRQAQQPAEELMHEAGPLKNYQDFGKILQLIAEERFNNWTASDLLVEADRLAQSLVRLQRQQAKQSLTEQIRQAEAAGDWAKAQQLLKQYQQNDTID